MVRLSPSTSSSNVPLTPVNVSLLRRVDVVAHERSGTDEQVDLEDVVARSAEHDPLAGARILDRVVHPLRSRRGRVRHELAADLVEFTVLLADEVLRHALERFDRRVRRVVDVVDRRLELGQRDPEAVGALFRPWPDLRCSNWYPTVSLTPSNTTYEERSRPPDETPVLRVLPRETLGRLPPVPSERTITSPAP